MHLHEKYALTPVINAAGTFTPIGVSRSSEHVRTTVAEALGAFFVIDELHTALSREVARVTGAEAAAVAHCVAAAITLSVAAAMTGSDGAKIAALPDARNMANLVVIPAGHAVDYGHPILVDIRLAGATPVLAGDPTGCTLQAIEAALAPQNTACLLLVSSRLVRGDAVNLAAAVAAAHRRGVPAIIDAAAQDMRIGELLATGADAVLLSAQKYLAAPTAGVIVGRQAFVAAVRAQERGIGRAMKATKEALLGVFAALEDRENLDLAGWREAQREKVAWLVERANGIAGLKAEAAPDPAGMPFPRVCLWVEAESPGWTAAAIAAELKAGAPSIWVMGHGLSEGKVYLELVPLHQHELQAIVERLQAISRKRRSDAH